MSDEKLGKGRPFRQWLRNQERLEVLDELGMNCSQVINRAIDDFLTRNWRALIDERMREIREVEKKAAASVP